MHDERILAALERRGEAVLEATGNGAVVFGRDDAPEAIFVVLEGEVVLDPAPEGFCVLGRGTVLGGLEFLTRDAGQEKGAKFPTSKAPISVVFHSFWLILGRVIISRTGLDRERLSLERARAERPR